MMMMEEEKHGVANLAYIPSSEDEIPVGHHVPPVETKKAFPMELEEEPSSTSSSKGCSIFGIRLKLCEKLFLSAAGVLVFLSWAAAIQGMVINGFVNVCISTLERRFGLRSTETGLIAGSYDIGSLLSVIPITYFGGRLGTSKPRYISMGLLVMGCGSLLFSLPHFVTDPYLSNVKSNLADVVNNSSESTSSEEMCSYSSSSNGFKNVSQEETDRAIIAASSLANFKTYFIFGQILHGIGAAPLVTLGTTFLDESVGKVAAPMYIGIFQTFFVVGPAVGYLVGGSFLEIYTDIDVAEAIVGLTSSSPLWVGAWWIGFLVACGMAWTCSAVIGCYPAIIPGGSDRYSNEMDKTSKGYGRLKDMPGVIWALLTNPTYMFINFGGGSDGFVISGLSAFLPKFIQSQYGFTAGLSAAIVGLLVIPAGGLGTFSGGYLAKRFKLTRSQVIKMYIYCQMVTIPMALGMLFYCNTPEFAGVTIRYPASTQPFEALGQKHPGDLAAECNLKCSCDIAHFNPVCGSDNVMYYSPCVAGCINKKSTDDNSTQYFDCACMNDTQKFTEPKTCQVGCSLFPGFLVFTFISIWFTFMSAMPNVVATLRSVEPVHRSLALGIESIFLRLIGTIPGPVFFGFIIDRTCLLEKSGSCLLYDNFAMAMALSMVVLAIKLIGVVFFGFALFFSNRSHIKDEPVSED